MNEYQGYLCKMLNDWEERLVKARYDLSLFEQGVGGRRDQTVIDFQQGVIYELVFTINQLREYAQ